MRYGNEYGRECRAMDRAREDQERETARTLSARIAAAPEVVARDSDLPAAGVAESDDVDDWISTLLTDAAEPVDQTRNAIALEPADTFEVNDFAERVADAVAERLADFDLD